MQSKSKTEIFVRVVDPNGNLMRLSALAPLMPPVKSVLADIREKRGPMIDPRRISMSEQAFPLFEIRGRPVLCVLASEQTGDDAETRWLWQERCRGLARAFEDLSRPEWRSVERLAQSPSLTLAAFVLTAVLETAVLAEKNGSAKRSLRGYTFCGSTTGEHAGAAAIQPIASDIHAVSRTVH